MGQNHGTRKTMADDEILIEAAPRMEQLATRLAQRFTPMSAANLLVASALVLLRSNLGSEATRAYFEELANSIPDERLQ